MPQWAHHARTEDDGSFALADRVASGTWSIEVFERQLASAKRVKISRKPDGEHLQIVTVAAEELETITGMVVDETGAPLEGAAVYCRELRYHSSDYARTDDNGTFRLERPLTNSVSSEVRQAREAGLAESVEIVVLRDGYQPLAHAERVPWGTVDLHLALKRAPSVEIRVVDRTTGEAVESFGLLLSPARVGDKWGISVDSGFELRNPQHHRAAWSRFPCRSATTCCSSSPKAIAGKSATSSTSPSNTRPRVQ